MRLPKYNTDPALRYVFTAARYTIHLRGGSANGGTRVTVPDDLLLADCDEGVHVRAPRPRATSGTPNLVGWRNGA